MVSQKKNRLLTTSVYNIKQSQIINLKILNTKFSQELGPYAATVTATLSHRERKLSVQHGNAVCILGLSDKLHMLQ